MFATLGYVYGILLSLSCIFDSIWCYVPLIFYAHTDLSISEKIDNTQNIMKCHDGKTKVVTLLQKPISIKKRCMLMIIPCGNNHKVIVDYLIVFSNVQK